MGRHGERSQLTLYHFLRYRTVDVGTGDSARFRGDAFARFLPVLFGEPDRQKVKHC